MTRNLGDAANKFTLEVFDETAYQIENAIAGKGQPSITVKYAAANNWETNEHKSVIFTGVCIDYQMSFVGRATMLSLEGILSAGMTADSSVDWWFKKATINWCNADLEFGDDDNNEIDGHSIEDAEYKALDPNGSRANYNDPKDIVCAYQDTTIIQVVDPETGEIEENPHTAIYINPSRIFRRIMAAYNQVHPGCFPVAEIEECRWIEGIDTIQQDETAAEYITRVLCKNAVTYTNRGSSEYKDQVAGFQYYVDGEGHHFKRLNYMDSNSTNTIELHFGTQNSRVISFSAANVGALAMAGFHKDTNYGELLANTSSIDKLFGESVTSGGENFAIQGGGGTIQIQSSEITSSNYFADMLSKDKLDITSIKSSATKNNLSAEYTSEYTNLENLPFEAQLSVWGDYSNDIKPGKFINLLTYDTMGHKHYTTGVYYITEVVDDISSEGFIQTATMIKNISAYNTGAINADDSTELNKSDGFGENTTGTVSYTLPQKVADDLQKVKGSGLSNERVNNANNRTMFTGNTTPIIPIN